jgi:hypothetical protein
MNVTMNIRGRIDDRPPEKKAGDKKRQVLEIVDEIICNAASKAGG